MSKARRNNANRIQIFDFIIEKMTCIAFIHAYAWVLCINPWNLITVIFGIELEKKMQPLKINDKCRILNPHQYMGTLYILFYLLFISAQFDESCIRASTSNSWNLLASHYHVLDFHQYEKGRKKKPQKNGPWSSRSCCRIFPFVFCWPSVMF